MRHLTGEWDNTNRYFKTIAMPWKEPFEGVPERKDFFWQKSLKYTSERIHFLVKLMSKLGLALSLILMFVFASFAIHVLTVVGIVHFANA